MDTQKLRKPKHLQKPLKGWRRNKKETTRSKLRTYFKRWQEFNPKYCPPWNFSCSKIQVFCVYLCLLVQDYLIFLHPNSNRNSFTILSFICQSAIFDGWTPRFILQTNKAYHISMKVMSGFQALCTFIRQYTWQYILSYQWMFWWNTPEVDLFVCRPLTKKNVQETGSSTN